MGPTWVIARALREQRHRLKAQPEAAAAAYQPSALADLDDDTLTQTTAPLEALMGKVTADQMLRHAADLVGGARARTHGDKARNMANIGRLWSAYLTNALDQPVALDGTDVALLMAIMKAARTQAGDHNFDDYVDLAGYGAVAGEVAETDRAEILPDTGASE